MSAWHSHDYARIEAAIRYLDAHASRQPSLAEAARAAHLSPQHFQRVFRRWAGISPKRFVQLLTVESAKVRLRAGRSVLDAAWGAGLSGPGRLHDLFVNLEAVTPGEFKTRGGGLRVRHGFHPTPFGTALLAATDRGICHLSFVDESRERKALSELRRAWPNAELHEDTRATAKLVARVFSGTANGHRRKPLTVLTGGTNFQAQVWRALLKIPPGARTTYGALAKAIGKPKAARAVGNAVASNPIAYLIPCHRVVRSVGTLGDYRWGPDRKRALLAWESVRAEA